MPTAVINAIGGLLYLGTVLPGVGFIKTPELKEIGAPDLKV